MKQARQIRADEITARALRMASERETELAQQMKDQSGFVEQKNKSTKVFLPSNSTQKEMAEFQKVNSQVKSKRRIQPELKPQDSIAPSYRRALEMRAAEGKPVLTATAHKQLEDGRYKAEGARPALRRENPTPHEVKKIMVAHGITHNSVEEARKRKKLEAKIREVTGKRN